MGRWGKELSWEMIWGNVIYGVLGGWGEEMKGRRVEGEILNCKNFSLKLVCACLCKSAAKNLLPTTYYLLLTTYYLLRP
jgi:hypothetical protein